MKRISSLILAAAFVVSSMGVAQAIDVKVKGTWDFAFGWAERTKFADSNRMKERGKRDNDNFIARQRVRTQVNFIASENLQGVLMFEIGNLDWGRAGNNKATGRSAGGQLDADGVNIETKRAYLDWMIPDTSLAIRMGIQGLSLPMATRFTNPVFSADVAAIVANYKFDDTFAVTAFWARPFDQYGNDGDSNKDRNSNRSLDDELDMFGVALPITLDGVSITPWGVLARVGSASGFYEYAANGSYGLFDEGDSKYSQNNTATGWWAGTGIAVDIWDPLTFAIDGMYGHLQKQEIYADGTEFGAQGWFLTATLDYRLDWGTPGLFGWWSTGDSKGGIKEGKRGRTPVVGTDGGFGPTSFGFAGATALTTDSIISNSGMGTWGVGLQVADMSFIEDLTHTIRVAYIQGTNDHKIVKSGLRENAQLDSDTWYMTTKDSAWEVNFDHKYQIYENLAAYLELGYINMDLNSNTWRNDSNGHKTDDAWKAQVLLRYSF